MKKIPDFEKCNDKFTFIKLSRHKDPFGLILANFIRNPHAWARDLFTTEGQKVYTNWLKYREGLNYNFRQEMNLLKSDSFKVVNHQHPEALKRYLRGDVSIDTLCIANYFIKFVERWDQQLEYDPVWLNISPVIKKYEKFLQFNREEIKKIMKDWLLNITP